MGTKVDILSSKDRVSGDVFRMGPKHMGPKDAKLVPKDLRNALKCMQNVNLNVFLNSNFKLLGLGDCDGNLVFLRFHSNSDLYMTGCLQSCRFEK